MPLTQCGGRCLRKKGKRLKAGPMNAIVFIAAIVIASAMASHAWQSIQMCDIHRGNINVDTLIRQLNNVHTLVSHDYRGPGNIHGPGQGKNKYKISRSFPG